MIVLRVWDDAGDQHILQLFDSEPVKLNYNFSDAQDIAQVLSNFSRSFRIPAVQDNIDLFGAWFNVNLDSNFDPRKKYRADIAWATIPQMTGHIQLKQVFVQKNQYYEFEIVFFGETSTLARELGDQKLWDFDWSDLDHTLTYDNVLDSINSSITGLPTDVVRYALVDKGQNFSELGGAGTSPLSDSALPLYAGDFTPTVLVSYLLNQLVNDAGFTMVSTFFDNLDDVYLLFYNGLPSITVDVLPQENNFNVGVTTDQSVTITDAFQLIPVENQSETAPFFDGNGNYTIGTPSYFTAPYFGIFYCDIWMTVDNTAGANDVYFRPVLYDINSLEIIGIAGGYQIVQDGFTANAEYMQFSIQLLDGQEVGLGMQVGFNVGETVIIKSTAAPDQINGTGWKVYASTQLAGGTVDMAANAPDYKAVDFIRDLTKIYNLVFVPAKDDPTKLFVEPFTDWIGSGNTVDWTLKLDIEKQLVIKPTVDLQSRNIEWTYKADGDVINKAVQDINARVYGRMLLDNTGNEFATGNQKIETFCSPTPCNAVPGTSVIIPRLIDQTGIGIKCNPRILHWAKIDVSTNIQFYDDIGAVVNTINYYPYVGHYDTPNAEVSTMDLNFGPEIPFHNITAVPYNTAFNVYWREYIDSLYSSSARIMTAYFNLQAADILSLNFNDNIFVIDSYWRINKINDYGIGTDTVTQVELIKILDAEPACQYTPSGQNDDGSIIFVDPSGATSAGDQACCELFDYEWNGSACFPKWAGAAPDYNQSSMSGGTQNGAGGIVGIAPNVSMPSGLFQTSVIGQSHQLEEGGMNTIHGFKHKMKKNIQAQIFGKAAIAEWPGLHLGGGWWHECGLNNENIGRAQHGKIILMSEGDLSTQNNELELFIEGIDTNRLVMLDDSAWACRIDIVVTDFNAATGNLVGVQSMTYQLALMRTGGAASSVGTLSTTLVEIGSYMAKFELSIDTATDTTQHRFILTATAASGLPAYDVKITATLTYTQMYSTCTYGS